MKCIGPKSKRRKFVNKNVEELHKLRPKENIDRG